MAFIELKNISLDFIVKTGSPSMSRAMIDLCRLTKSSSAYKASSIKHSRYRALDNISLSLSAGDRLAVVGKNGAGKSTLLRVLAKIYKPKLGSIVVKGQISTIFDVTLGMNFEASGYENIINLGMMKGYSKKQVKAIVYDIEEFVGSSVKLNNIVSTYSAGMQVKLMFAVATAFSPEIILVDEVIGTGDIHFVKKAIERLEAKVMSSHILVLASHSEDIIKQFCNKLIVMDQGQLRFIGEVEEGLQFYHSLE